MKKIDISAISTTNGMPIKSGTIDHLQSAYQEAIASTVKSIIFGSLYDAAKGYILHGCVNTGTGSNYIISAGAIFYNGEVFQVPAATFTISGSNIAVGSIQTTYFSATNADPVTFTDAVNRNVHQIRQIVFAAGLSGSGAFNFNNSVNMNYRPSGAIGQVINWKIPSGTLSNYFDGTGLGTHPLTSGWAIANGSNGTDDFRGRVPVGYYSGDSTFGTIGATGGERTHTLIADEMPAHYHIQGSESLYSDYGGGSLVTGQRTYPDGTHDSYRNAHTSTVGNDQAHNNLQPYRVTLLIQRIS
jgi:hypothetical protein